MNVRRSPLANRLPHSRVHITDGLAPQRLSLFYQRRYPLLAAQIAPGQICCATSPSTSQDGSPNPPCSDPFLRSAKVSSAIVSWQAHSRSQSDLLQHSANPMTPALGFARPVPRTAQSQFTSMDAFQVTPELIVEAHSLGTGMSRVAYAGGIRLVPNPWGYSA